MTISRQSISKYYGKLQEKEWYNTDWKNYIYYFAYKGTQTITTRTTYRKAWDLYWDAKEKMFEEMAEYRERLTVADGKVTLENSQILNAYGVTLRYKGTENEYFNLYAKNNSNNTTVIRSYNTKINGKSANFSVYEILEPGAEKDISACMTSAIENKTDTISMTFALEDDSNNEIFNTGEINFAAE